MVEKGIRVKGFNRKERKEVSQGSQRDGGKRDSCKGFNRKERKEVSQGSQRVGGKRVLTAKGRKGLASKTVSIP
jgi:hypothetical protein